LLHWDILQIEVNEIEDKNGIVLTMADTIFWDANNGSQINIKLDIQKIFLAEQTRINYSSIFLGTCYALTCPTEDGWLGIKDAIDSIAVFGNNSNLSYTAQTLLNDVVKVNDTYLDVWLEDENYNKKFVSTAVNPSRWTVSLGYNYGYTGSTQQFTIEIYTESGMTYSASTPVIVFQ